MDIREFFESDDPEVLALTQRVFDKCILEELQPPAEPLQHTWVRPGGPYYNGQWIWDTMFVVDLLSLLPDQKKVIRDIFQNYWDFQDRWNQRMPAYVRDMVGHGGLASARTITGKSGSSRRRNDDEPT